jgi:hypothetical protein
LTVTLNLTSILLLVGLLPVLYVAWYTVGGTLLWLRHGSAQVTLRFSGPYTLLVLVLIACAVWGIVRALVA